jgi:molybdenum cofactor biosynthesis protein B
MVDFQERDTTRGISSVDEDDEEAQSETAAEGEEDESENSEQPEAEAAEEAEEPESEAVEEETEPEKAGEGGESESAETPGATIKSEDDDGPDAKSDPGHEDDHDHHAHDLDTVRAAVVTISSSRSIDEDTAGAAIVSAMEDDGAEIATRDLVRDDFDNVQAAVDALVGRGDVDVVITTGGTGVSPDDVTVEAGRQLFEKELHGFGELFRRLSYEEIGSRVVGSRATAGIADGVPVFCLPGSEAAVRLGVEEIVLPEAGHLAGLARRDDEEE